MHPRSLHNLMMGETHSDLRRLIVPRFFAKYAVHADVGSRLLCDASGHVAVTPFALYDELLAASVRRLKAHAGIIGE